MASDLQGSTLTINGRAYRPIMATYNADLWTAQNPILQRGEIGVEQDTLLFKVGNGTDRWNDLGYATGEPGPRGPEGPYYLPSVDSSGNLSWSNDGGLPNPNTVNIKGPQGETGATGATGATGPQGPEGPEGPQGDPGLVVKDVIVNSSTSVIDITTSANITNAPTCKALFGGNTIAGTWSGSGTAWSFTPTTASDITTTAWIITLP